METAASRRQGKGTAPPGPRVPWVRRSLSGAALLALSVGGCNGDTQERIPLGEALSGANAPALPADVQMQLDSGNLAYRMRDYDQALLHFREVVRLEPGLAAGWYGVGMTEAARGNAAGADSAMARVHALAPDVPLQHPTRPAPPNPHPAPPATPGSSAGPRGSPP